MTSISKSSPSKENFDTFFLKRANKSTKESLNQEEEFSSEMDMGMSENRPDILLYNISIRLNKLE